MKKFFSTFVIVVSLFALTLPALAQQAPKIAVVNLQRALNEVEEGKKSKAAIQADMNTKKKVLEDQKTALKALKDDLDKKKSVLSDAAVQEKANEIQAKFMDLQKKAMDFEQELKTKENQSVQKILTALRTLVINMAKQEKYDLVFENSAEVVLYSATAKDMTDDLIKAYNRGGQ